jgi:hypothetical protein
MGWSWPARWVVHQSGQGLDAPATGGWLVTFASNVRTMSSGVGYLVAYEILAGRKGRGRPLLLTGRMQPEDDQALLDRARQQSWWTSRKQPGSRADVDIEVLAEWLDEQPEVVSTPAP